MAVVILACVNVIHKLLWLLVYTEICQMLKPIIQRVHTTQNKQNLTNFTLSNTYVYKSEQYPPCGGTLLMGSGRLQLHKVWGRIYNHREGEALKCIPRLTSFLVFSAWFSFQILRFLFRKRFEVVFGSIKSSLACS